MKADRIESGLQARTWSFNRQPETLARQIVLLTDGDGECESGKERFHIAAPAVLWLGSMRSGRLRAEAGATGFHGWADDRTVIAAIGDQPESASLRYLADRDFLLSLAGRNEQAAMIERSIDLVVEELRQGRAGASLMLSALLRIILIGLMRLSEGELPTPPAPGEKSDLLRRFRRLVEMNFRSHWSIRQYAAALGISPDRLHAICTSGVGKSPKALVAERLAQEAALRLERSSLTIQQLAHALGFHDPAHFSHFFRKMMGMPPGSYRRALVDARNGLSNAPPRNFADWP